MNCLDINEIMQKCILTKEELKDYNEKMKDLDHTHARDFRTMTNPIRREMIKTIGYSVKTTEELMTTLELAEDQIKYHLSMVEQTLYILNTKDGWKLTPRGIGFLNNTSIEF